MRSPIYINNLGVCLPEVDRTKFYCIFCVHKKKFVFLNNSLQITRTDNNDRRFSLNKFFVRSQKKRCCGIPNSSPEPTRIYAKKNIVNNFENTCGSNALEFNYAFTFRSSFISFKLIWAIIFYWHLTITQAIYLLHCSDSLEQNKKLYISMHDTIIININASKWKQYFVWWLRWTTRLFYCLYLVGCACNG